MGTNVLPSSDVSVALSATGSPHAAQVNDNSPATYCYRYGSGSASDELGVPSSSPIPYGAIITQVLLKFKYSSDNGYYGACAGTPWAKLGSSYEYGTGAGNNCSLQTTTKAIPRPGGGSWEWSDFSSIHLGYTLTGDEWVDDSDPSDPITYYYSAYCHEVYLEIYWTTAEQSPMAYSFEEVSPNSEYETGRGYFSVKNNSDFAIKLCIQGTDMTGGTQWDLSSDGNPDTNEVGIKAGLEEDEDYEIVVSTSSNTTLKSSLAANSTQKWGLKLYTPTNSPFADTEAKTGYIILTASAA